MAPYMATTCKGLISCAISPLNQGLKKIFNSGAPILPFSQLLSERLSLLSIPKRAGRYELIENFYSLPVEKRSPPWLLSEEVCTTRAKYLRNLKSLPPKSLLFVAIK